MLNRLRDWWNQYMGVGPNDPINVDALKHWRNGRYSSCDDPECRVCR